MKDLIEQSKKCGQPLPCPLSYNDAEGIPDMYQPNFYAFYYGSFSEAAQIAWKMALVDAMPKPQEKIRRPNIMTTTKSEKNSSAPPSKPKRATRKSHFNKEMIIERLLEYYDKNGRLPTQLEIAITPELPSWTTISKFLGPKSEWGKQFALPPIEQALPAKKAASSAGKPSSSTKEVTVETAHYNKDNAEIIELKINLPDRTKPILVTLTI